MDFWSALTHPDMVFLRYALLAGLISAIPFGMTGSLVVVQRISYLAGAVAHSILGGVGLALYLQTVHGWSWFHPLWGATVAAVVSALATGWIHMHYQERTDSVISAIWVIGMSIGVVFFSLTPGYVDVNSYLFGNILLVGLTDLRMVAGLAVLVSAFVVVFYPRLLAISFDEEFSLLRGVSSRGYQMVFLVLTSLSIVVMVRIVGIIMVVALLTLPAAAAGRFVRHLWQMMLVSTLLVAFCTVLGIYLSFVWELPAGAVIVLINGVIYALSLLLSMTRKRGA